MVNKQKEELTAASSMSNAAMNELNQSVQLFKGRLGMSFVKKEKEQLQVVFTMIDPRKHDREFHMTILLTNDDVYTVTECVPSVPLIDTLLDDLNKTNNFSAFVIAMRKEFQKLV
jgi:kinetochore protein Spc25